MPRHDYTHQFILTECAPHVEPIQQQLRSTQSGAEVVFTGVARSVNKGKEVVRLEFEAYTSLAHAEANRILLEAGERWPLHRVIMAHTTGVCTPGEVAVVVAVSAAHRKEAFEACAWLMDELKKRLPIWKKEVYTDGAQWVSPTP